MNVKKRLPPTERKGSKQNQRKKKQINQKVPSKMYSQIFCQTILRNVKRTKKKPAEWEKGLGEVEFLMMNNMVS
jgi:hypothetical protein